MRPYRAPVETRPILGASMSRTVGEPCASYTWCIGTCNHSQPHLGEWASAVTEDGIGTVKIRRTEDGIEIAAGRILPLASMQVAIGGARVLYHALGRALHA